jgi:hypothetical protein
MGWLKLNNNNIKLTNIMKKTIHALTIIDKSSSMNPYRSRTIEGINTNILALKKEVDADTEILNTQLQFSGTGHSGGIIANEMDFVFKRVGQSVKDLPDMTLIDYEPSGWTPLLDAIGYGIEKVKDFHGDKLGDENLSIIVTIFTDGAENSSKQYSRDEIKKMIEHFQSDGKWTFTFVGCGSFEDVSATSATLGVSANNTVAYVVTDSGTADAYAKIATSYTNYTVSRKLGRVDNDLFTEKKSS